jgi:TPR repeat protein
MYENGTVTEKNSVTAMDWLVAAASNGNAAAQTILATKLAQ